MTSSPIPNGAGPAPELVDDRLDWLRERLVAIEPERPSGLSGLRSDVEAARVEAEDLRRPNLAKALGRLALMIEVWDCLAAELPGSALGAASFCIRALDRLAAPDGESRDAENASWILRESSESWSDYLSLLDPGFDDDPHADTTDAQPTPPEIDAATLVRMLTGSEPTPAAIEREDDEPTQRVRPVAPETPGLPFSEPAPPAPQREESKRRPAPTPALEPDIDPDCREAFLSEAIDLFERIEALVLSLNRGPGHVPALHELGRCYHTLKGAAGSVGLIELASRVHFLEEELEEAGSVVSPELLDRLHQSLSHLEGVLDALRQGPRPRVETELGARTVAEDDSSRREPRQEGTTSVSGPTATVEPGRSSANDPPSSNEPADGPVRVSSARIDELMDLASELIMRRGLWTAQSEKLKRYAGLIRAGRNELMSRLDQLNDLGISRGGGGGQFRAAGLAKTGKNVDPSTDLMTVVLRLAEQAEDLVVLTEAAQAQVLPLTDDSDSLARLTLQLWETLQSIRIVPVRGLFQRLARGGPRCGPGRGARDRGRDDRRGDWTRSGGPGQGLRAAPARRP